MSDFFMNKLSSTFPDTETIVSLYSSSAEDSSSNFIYILIFIVLVLFIFYLLYTRRNKRRFLKRY